MSSVLVVYGTGEGQTAAIAERIGVVLEAAGHDVSVLHARHRPDGFDIGNYDAAVVAGSVHRGKHQKYVTRFVGEHRDALNAMPTAFCSVSLSAAGDADSRAAAEEIITEFLDATEFEPDVTVSVAGALKYSEYGPLTRFVLQRIARKEGGDTDTARDHEYTDWEQVEGFAADFAERLAPGAST